MARTRKIIFTALSEPEAKRFKTSLFLPFTAPEFLICFHCTQLIYQASLASFTSAESFFVLAVIYTPAVSSLSVSSPAEDFTVAL
jgi:hypothetical protein